MDPASLTEPQLLGWLRAWQLNFIRLGKPEGEVRDRIAAKLDAGGDPATEAALMKDLGNALEREIPERLRSLALTDPASAQTAPYRALLAHTIVDATSYTLRGGTPEVLRGMIARGLGLR